MICAWIARSFFIVFLMLIECHFEFSKIISFQARAAESNKTKAGLKSPTPNGLKTVKAKKTSLQPKGVVARYNNAMRLFDAGKFNEALVAFDAIHKTYPAHEPTIIQYAKTLYRLDRIPESYNLFSRINPQYLDPETSYEYGYAFYIQNKYDAALFAFKKVPLDHTLFDLASYYGAMCAIRLKKYAEAEELLDKAVVLPDKLARSKPLYQKHVTSLRQLQEKSELAQSENAEKQRFQAETLKQKLPPPSSPVTATAAVAENKPYAHGGFYSVDRFGKIRFKQKTQSSDLHSFSRKNYSTKGGEFLFSQGPMWPLPLKLDANRQASLGGQIDLNASSLTTVGTQDRLVAYEDSRDIVHNLTERIPSQTSNSGEFAGSIWIETPLPSGWWLGSDAHLGFSYPEFKRGQRYGYRGGTGHVGWIGEGLNLWKFELESKYDQIVDSEAEPVTIAITTKSILSVKTTLDLTISGEIKNIYYDYKVPILPGPDSSTSGTLKLVQSFPLKIDLTLSGTYDQQQNYIVRNIGTYSSASADGQISSGSAKLSLNPFDWISVSSQYTIAKTQWSVHQIERAEAFKAATPDYTETTEILGAIIFNF